jgi:AraC family transcriptional regulator, transcriptional activator of pobA
MLNVTSSFELNNDITNDAAFSLCFIDGITIEQQGHDFETCPYYTILWLKDGAGKIFIDANQYCFKKNTIFFLSPNQKYLIDSNYIKAVKVSFSADFYCIQKHKKEVSCDGVLFNNSYQSPHIILNECTDKNFDDIISKIVDEFKNPNIAHAEMLLTYLKILLINSTRIKLADSEPSKDNSHVSLSDRHVYSETYIKLKELIDMEFRENHSPSHYASSLNINAKSLEKIVKNEIGKTISDLIKERIIIEAKRLLCYSSYTVKEIAFDIGFNDPAYFSRYFKKSTQLSPQEFKDSWGNLSN